MAGRLTARKVTTAKAGKYSDGNNLYLVVSRSGSRKWVLRFTWRGRSKEMGLGSASSVPLSSAREKAAVAVRALEAGQNPIAQRKRTGGIPSFGEMADEVVAALSPGFRNQKHRAQWKSTLATYAAPLRDMPVDTVSTDDVLSVLKPIWTEKPRRPHAFAVASKRYSMRPRRRGFELPRTRPAGADTWITCCHGPQS